MKKKVVILLLIVEAFFLLLTIGNMFRPLVKQTFSYSDLNLVDGKIWDGYGIRTKNLDRIEREVANTPSFDIQSGVYEIEVSYNTDGEENYVLVKGANENFDSVRYDSFYLNPGASTQSFQVFVNKNLRAFQVSAYNDGKSETIYESIRINELMSGRIAVLLKTICAILLLNVVLWIIDAGRNGKIKKEWAMLVSVIGGTVLFASYPLFNNFITASDDIMFHLLRIEGIKDGLLAGQFPVRIHPTQFYGYGYANSIFYGELFLYFPAVLRLCGITLQNSYKIFLLTINLFTAIITFWSVRSIFKNDKIAAICMALYVLSPYRLINIYGRGAVGEYCAMMFWPIIICGLYHLFADDTEEQEYRRNWITLVVGYSGLIQTHLLSCEMAAIFSVIVCVICWKKCFRVATIIELIKFFVATILLNAFFLVPFLDYMSHGGVIVADYGSQQTKAIQGNGLYLAHLFQLFVKGRGMAYGHGELAYKGYGMQNELGTTVGIALLVPIIVFVYCYLMHNDKFRKDKYYKLAVTMFVFSIATLYMSSNLFPWDVLCRNLGNVVANIQFPWRFLSLASIFLVILLGCILVIARKYTSDQAYRMLVVIIIALNVVSCGYLLYDNLVSSKALYTYDGTGLLQYGSGSLDEYRPTGCETSQLQVVDVVTTENVSVDFYYKKYTNIVLYITENDHMAGMVSLPLLAYRGYQAIDESGNAMELVQADNGVLTLLVPNDFSGNVSISYKGFLLWDVATWISIISFLAFLGLLLKFSLKNVDINVNKGN